MKFFKYITEGYLRSEFSIGFELEAILTGIFDDANHVILNYTTKYFPGGKIVSDSSIKPDKETDFAFEYNSPALLYTPKNIKRLENFFLDLEDNNIYTNKSCGLHFHVAFPFITDEDMKWIVCQLALDEKMQKKIGRLMSIKFFNKRYAEKKFLERIATSIKTEDYETLNALLTDEKYRIIRMHPIGTLEWRGPRNFLDKGNPDLIKEFLYLLDDYITWMNKTFDIKFIDGMSKQEFFKKFEGIDISPIIDTRDEEDNKFSPEQDRKQLDKIFKKFPWLSKADFESALITIDDGELVWLDGEWNKGIWEDGLWLDGTWYTGVWTNGVWTDGLWEDGLWKNGQWLDGVWKKGNIEMITNDKKVIVNTSLNPKEFFDKYGNIESKDELKNQSDIYKIK